MVECVAIPLQESAACIMTSLLPITPAPGPLEEFAAAFDDLLDRRSQRQALRRYLEGLLLPAERNKTLTALANTEPIVGATKPQAQQLQWFLSESTWDPDEINQRRVQMLMQAAPTAPTEHGVLVIDETGDRKWGTKTAHVGRQYLGSLGKIDNGVVSVSSLWADEACYWPVACKPYTPAHHFPEGKADAAFATKPQLALQLVQEAQALALPFRAVVADCFYGEQRDWRAGLRALGVGYVLALKASHSWWHPVDEIGAVDEVAQAAPWTEQAPGPWARVERRFGDGHQETWWALEGHCALYSPQRAERLVIVTTDPALLPEPTTWYLVTNLPAPGSVREPQSSLRGADLAEIVRLYGLRIWVEQSYKQVKGTLGWAQYQVRSDLAIRRHWTLVFLAFSFCWWALSGSDSSLETSGLDLSLHPPPETVPKGVEAGPAVVSLAREKKCAGGRSAGELAAGLTPSAGVAGAVCGAGALLESVVGSAPTRTSASPAGLAQPRTTALSLLPMTTNY